MAWLAYVMAILMLLTVSVSHQQYNRTHKMNDAAYAIDTARNFGIYSSKASVAFALNPAFNGVIPVGSLNLPTWYRPQPGLAAFANAGHLFVYQAQPNAVTGGRVLKQIASTGAVVGMCISGTIYSTANVALMVAPVGMPNLAVVMIVV